MRATAKRRVPQAVSDAVKYVRYDRWRLPRRHEYLQTVDGRSGIEVGGPSAVFRTILPVYEYVRALDGVNFATDTIWEGQISEGAEFAYFPGKTGRQFIAEATDLSAIDAQYDFLLSSNCLEHVANPIKALQEWRRLIRPGGGFVLVLPNKASNFDHRRPVTTLDHLLADFSEDVGEDDMTHLEEILALHDLSMDPPAGTLSQFRERSLDNLHNRTLHHHVFDEQLIDALLRHLDFDVVDISTTRSDFFALATKA